MPIIERTITTSLPKEKAFRYLADFSNAAEWDPGTVSSTPRDGAPPHAGQTYDLVVAWGNRRLEMVYEITDLVPNRSITLRGLGSTTVAEDTIRVSTDGPDTVVEYRADIRLRGVLRIVEPFLRPKFRSLGDEAEYGLAAALGARLGG